jgi:hypothetical protein
VQETDNGAGTPIKDLRRQLDTIIEICGPRTPARQIRVLLRVAEGPDDFRNAMDIGLAIGAPERTVTSDLMRLGTTDRHGEPGLGFVVAERDKIEGWVEHNLTTQGAAFLTRLLGDWR